MAVASADSRKKEVRDAVQAPGEVSRVRKTCSCGRLGTLESMDVVTVAQLGPAGVVVYHLYLA